MLARRILWLCARGALAVLGHPDLSTEHSVVRCTFVFI